jgi:hypothetical protein
VKISRAGFLKACGVGLLGQTVDRPWTAIGDVFAADAPLRPGSTFRIEHASAADFRPHLHSTFTAESSEGARVPLVLTQITERPPARGVQQFSLVFDVPMGGPALDGTNAFRHPLLGRFDLFMVPIGAASPQRTVYEACFSRHVPVSRGARSEADTRGGDSDAAD